MELQIDKAKYFLGWKIEIPAFTSWKQSFIRELRFYTTSKFDWFMGCVVRAPRVKAWVNDNGDLIVTDKQWYKLLKRINKQDLIDNTIVMVDVKLKKGKNKWRKL